MTAREGDLALVLGGTGFIGGHVARAALERGWRVRALRRRPGATGHIGDLGEQIAWIEGDLESRDALETAMRGCRLVFHAAGYYPMDLREQVDHVGTALRQMRNVIAAAQAAGVERLVYTSSLSTIGRPSRPDELATEADWYQSGQARHPYWEAKLVQEQEALRANANGQQAESPLSVIVLNPTAVFGPADIKPTTGQAVLIALRLRCWLSLEGRVNVVDVRDVAAAHVAAAERGRPGERTILGGHNVTIEQFVRAIAAAAGLAPPRLRLALGWLYGPAWRSEQFVSRLFPHAAHLLIYALETLRLGGWFDCRKAQAELGLCPRPLQQTLNDTVAWFRQHGYI